MKHHADDGRRGLLETVALAGGAASARHRQAAGRLDITVVET